MRSPLRPAGFPAVVRAAAAKHAAMLGNAGALALGALSSAVLGFAYWWLAARSFTPEAVGFAAAAVSMMNLLAHVGEIGLGPFLIGNVGRSPAEASTMIATAVATAALSCVACAAAGVGVDAAFGLGMGRILATPAAAAAFTGGVVLTGVCIVLDQAFIGLLRAGVQMWRNMAFSASKLVLLATLAASWGSAAGERSILATWLLGLVASLAVSAIIAGSHLRERWPSPRFGLLRPLAGEVLGHHVLNVALQAPALALPFVVTVSVSAAGNAAFFAAWSLLNVVLLVPASLASVLFSTGAREPRLLRARLRLSLWISLATVLGAGFGFLLFSPVLLGLFSPTYAAIAGSSLKLLGFGTLGVAIKYHYVALRRLADATYRAAVLLALGGILEIAAAAAGARYAGLDGLTRGWLFAVLLQSFAMAPEIASVLNVPRKKARIDAAPGLGLT